MVNFPEADPKSLPKMELTSLQQKFNAAYNEMLVAKRTWKSSQMAFQSLASQFKTYLTRQFGEDYLETMVSEFRDVEDNDGNVSVSTLDIMGNPAFQTGVQLLMGPFAEDIAPPTEPKVPPSSTSEQSPLFTLYNTQKAQYDNDLVEYQEEVAIRKSYLGIPKPDITTCSRMLTLIVKMRDYEVLAMAKQKDMVYYATSSLSQGEIPTSAILRAVAKERKVYDGSKRTAVIKPIDWNTLGISSDNPKDWDEKAFMNVLLTPWYSPEGNTFRSTNANYIEYRRLITAQSHTGNSWNKSWQDWNKSKWGIDTRDVIPATSNTDTTLVWHKYTLAKGNHKVNLSPMLLFYAKAYGKTSDPLLFWSTHSKYRLVAEDRGSFGVHVLLSRVDARFGAQSGQSVPVGIFAPGTATGNAIATMRTYYPYVMDIETGNNPKLDKLIGESVVTQNIKKAGAEFAKLPPSSKQGMRYIAVTTTNLTIPTSIVFSNKFNQATTDKDFSKYNNESEEYRFWAYHSPHSPYTKNDKKKMYWDSNPTAIGLIDGWGPSNHYTRKPPWWDGYKEGYDYSKFNWVNWTSKTIDWYRSKGDASNVQSGKNTMPSPDFINQIFFGWPNPHPDARVISTVDIFLVPEAYEAGLSQLYARLRDSTGKTKQLTFEGYEGLDVPIMDWVISQQLLLVMQSGLPFVRKSILPFGGGTIAENTGLPITSQTAFDGTEESFTPATNPTNEISATVAMANEYGLNDFSGIEHALSVAVNDVDDIQDILSDFRQAYPGVSELVYPDAPDEMFTPSARVVNGVATSFRFRERAFEMGKNHYRSGPPISGTTMIQRIPINTKGFSGKRYTFGDYMRTGTPVKFSTNERDLWDPSAVTYSTTSNTMFLGGLAVAGMVVYKGLKKAGL